MVNSIIFLPAMLGALLLFGGAGNTHVDTPDVIDIPSQEHIDSLVSCYKEKAYWEVNGIKEEDLPEEANKWCLLIITDGERPTYENKEIIDIRTLNLTTDQIDGNWFGVWKYWLACDTRYR